jgi:hypothetical protein
MAASAHINQDEEIASEKLSGTNWLKEVLSHLCWAQLYTVWKQCNADLHGINTANQEYKQKAKLKPSFEALYSTAAYLDYLDRHYLLHPSGGPSQHTLLRTRSMDQHRYANCTTC